LVATAMYVIVPLWLVPAAPAMPVSATAAG
jgi:hypothetical protein